MIAAKMAQQLPTGAVQKSCVLLTAIGPEKTTIFIVQSHALIPGLPRLGIKGAAPGFEGWKG